MIQMGIVKTLLVCWNRRSEVPKYNNIWDVLRGHREHFYSSNIMEIS